MDGDADAEACEEAATREIDFELPHDDYFAPDLTHQPSLLRMMRISPGVSIRDLNTGEMRSSEMASYEGQMSRQDYRRWMGLDLELPQVLESLQEAEQASRPETLASIGPLMLYNGSLKEPLNLNGLHPLNGLHEVEEVRHDDVEAIREEFRTLSMLHPAIRIPERPKTAPTRSTRPKAIPVRKAWATR